MPHGDKKPSRFPDTHWSMVNRAGASDELIRREAIAELLTIYTPALRLFLIRDRQIPMELANDILHDFLLDKILIRRILDRADRNRGRFRNFILKSLSNFATTKLKREFSARARSVGFSDETLTDNKSMLSADAFELEWISGVVQETLRLMNDDCVARGRQDLWKIFSLRVVDPMLHDVEPADYWEIVKQLGIETPRQAINLLATTKRVFMRHLREVVGRYTESEEEIEEEIMDLRRIIGR